MIWMMQPWRFGKPFKTLEVPLCCHYDPCFLDKVARSWLWKWGIRVPSNYNGWSLDREGIWSSLGTNNKCWLKRETSSKLKKRRKHELHGEAEWASIEGRYQARIGSEIEVEINETWLLTLANCQPFKKNWIRKMSDCLRSTIAMTLSELGDEQVRPYESIRTGYPLGFQHYFYHYRYRLAYQSDTSMFASV